MTPDELQSKTFTFMRFLLIIGVVAIHFNIGSFYGNPFSYQGVEYTNNPLWFEWIVCCISQTFASIAVPLFYVIAGYLFFYHLQGAFSREDYVHKLRSRCSTLLVPYIIWNILFIVVRILNVSPLLSSFTTRGGGGQINLTFSSIIHAFYNTTVDPIIISDGTDFRSDWTPVDPPLWFLRDLMVLVVLTPLIYWLLKKIGSWLLLIIGILWIGSLSIEQNYITVLIPSLFFFVIGAYWSIYSKNIVLELRRVKYTLWIYPLFVITDVLLLQYGYDIVYTYFHPFCILVGIVTFVNLCSMVVERGYMKVNVFLSNSVFFIFATHYMLIAPVSKIIFKVLGVTGTPLCMIVLYFSTIALMILLCLGVYWFLHRFTPKLCGLLTGGR